jgi:hypothetical protein
LSPLGKDYYTCLRPVPSELQVLIGFVSNQYHRERNEREGGEMRKRWGEIKRSKAGKEGRKDRRKEGRKERRSHSNCNC